MQNKFNRFGFWWKQEDQSTKFPGELSYSQENGIQLKIFTDDTLGSEKHNQDIRIMQGYFENGKPVTLLNCQYLGGSTPFVFGIARNEFLVSYAFVGEHFNEEQDIMFDSIFGHFTDLDLWDKQRTISHKDLIENGELVSKQISYKTPEDIKFNISNNISVGVLLHTSASSTLSGVNVKKKNILFIETINEKMNFFDLHKYLIRFANLLQLATQRKTYNLEIYGKNYIETTDEEERNKFRKVDIYYQPIEAIRNQRTLTPLDYLFSLDELDENKIKNWFDIYNIYTVELDSYQSLFFKERFFIASRLLTTFQVLESLHSNLFGNRILPIDEFRDRRRTILDNTPDRYKTWLNEIFNNANCKHFKDKILELLINKNYLMKNLIIDFEKFSESVRDTRNEIVHHNKKDKSFNKSDWLFAHKILTYLFECYILELIGFTEKEIEKIIMKQIDSYLTWGKKL